MTVRAGTWALAITLGLLSVTGGLARAETRFLPRSRHAAYQGWGGFPGIGWDSSSSLLWVSGGRAWASIAAPVALLDQGDSALRPQTVAIGAVGSAMRFSTRELELESADSALALAEELELSPACHLAVGVAHLSGHVLEDITDPGLAPLNLDNNQAFGRVVWSDAFLKAGLTLRPTFESEPHVGFFAADQFVAWFPSGQSTGEESAARGAPYLAFALDEQGVAFPRSAYRLSASAQAVLSFASSSSTFTPKR